MKTVTKYTECELKAVPVCVQTFFLSFAQQHDMSQISGKAKNILEVLKAAFPNVLLVVFFENKWFTLVATIPKVLVPLFQSTKNFRLPFTLVIGKLLFCHPHLLLVHMMANILIFSF